MILNFGCLWIFSQNGLKIQVLKNIHVVPHCAVSETKIDQRCNVVTDGQTARLRDYIYKYFCGN